jgi:hypothetical protein
MSKLTNKQKLDYKIATDLVFDKHDGFYKMVKVKYNLHTKMAHLEEVVPLQKEKHLAMHNFDMFMSNKLSKLGFDVEDYSTLTKDEEGEDDGEG